MGAAIGLRCVFPKFNQPPGGYIPERAHTVAQFGARVQGCGCSEPLQPADAVMHFPLETWEWGGHPLWNFEHDDQKTTRETMV